MAKYRKISARIWNDAKFASLSDDGKLTFLLVLTHPHMTPLGAMRMTAEGLAAELGWPTERLREAFAETSRKALLKVDARARCVFAPNFLKHNPPESPNVVSAWSKCLDDIPECQLKTLAIQEAISRAESMSEAFGKSLGSLREAFGKGMPNQEQEQEQEQEQDQSRAGAASAPAQPDPSAAQPTGSRRSRSATAQGKRLELQTLPEEWARWAKTARPDLNPLHTWDRFRDYWVAQPGQKGRKADWQATWRNWVRNEKSPGGSNGQQPARRDWWESATGIRAKAEELGLREEDYPGFPHFADDVRKRAGIQQ